MDPLDELEMIIMGEIAKRQKEIYRARRSGIKPSSVSMNGVEHEKIGLERALELQAIRKNDPGVSPIVLFS